MTQSIIFGESQLPEVQNLREVIYKGTMSEIVLGLGTNLGDRLDNLQQAVDGLAREMSITAVSSIYQTHPWGIIDQPDFLNCCLMAETDLSPQELLTFIKNLEAEIGRLLGKRWGPRLIDIDILFYANQILETEKLTIPHPGLHERAFVLRPLADIAPDFVHPLLGQTVSELLTAVPPTDIKPYLDVNLQREIAK
ncbi:2-amino-4-hydroxy-6-hydroxymethyldihydropteridinepyrophosphokinase [hydrothermal vent metagenome]|uniref:2-amino-4-hydroxy-6-hydroxymethyldihydropteridine diphosphokinase n=1 Tax=hydrothermal vent metagenome TaxID=652676 RepID=A0A3B0VRL1_9ZZZZ